MKAFFKDLFEYTHHYNKAVVAAIIENQDKVSQKVIQLVSHIINVHQIWNAKIDHNESTSFAAWAMHEIWQLNDLEDENFSRSLAIIANNELDSLVGWKTSAGAVFINSTQDILFQIINHSTYHRAQIATEFKQTGLAPLLTDFIYYKMAKSQ